jgi:hypothetical protein
MASSGDKRDKKKQKRNHPKTKRAKDRTLASRG